ncbi:salutaridinol 7-O-acetyltransferase-like [Cucurbita moschata]|uniref:Salutaridinol 7-O-acetyltransferase-like n=1 Tax=Cucurbita moschata TaxID=3662 RepID=A0A6J1GVJ3_CUCMO|nr:salutaridinol 7-O-acetyltransferase-like [Cucurbita moschata]
MEVEIISSETIKPSSFPPSLRSLKLSVLDQLSPFTYTSLVFFYSLKHSHVPLHLSHPLKASLSHALSDFYLLAGAIKDNTHILDNGVGALFQVARVHRTMPEFLNQPSFESLSQLIPFRYVQTRSLSTMEPSYPQVAVQLNAFSGGGVAVGVCFLHKIIDGTTLSGFLRRWASMAGVSTEEKGGGEQPEYGTAATFPGRELLVGNSWLSKGYSPFVGEGRICRKRFVFDGAAISELKEEVKRKSDKIPTSVEVVTGFIWKYMMIAARQSSRSRRSSVLTHAVDLRRRMAPPLPATSIGNIFWSAVAHYDTPKAEIELSELVDLVQRSVAEIDEGFIREMAGEEGFEGISRWFMRMKELYTSKPYSYGFTSWRNMGLNEVDFGWGKASWVSVAGPENSVLKNVVVLKEGILGDGIEAWIMLDEDEMNILENDQQFLAFASFNPTIILA